MRRLVIGALVAGVAAGACNRNPDTVSGTPAAGQPDASVATTGTVRSGARAYAARGGGAQDRARGHNSGWHRAGRHPGYERGVGYQRAWKRQYARISRRPSWLMDNRCSPRAARSAAWSPARRGRRRSRDVHSVGLRFDSLTPAGADERYRIETAAISRTARRDEKRRCHQDRRTSRRRRDHRRHRWRRGGRGHWRSGRRRRRNGRRALDARQGDSTAGRQHPARAPHRAAHDSNERIGTRD